MREPVKKSGNLSSTGRKGVCGKPRKGVLHEDDPHFSELFEGLKNASACRKDFFDTLTWPSPAFAGEGHTADV